MKLDGVGWYANSNIWYITLSISRPFICTDSCTSDYVEKIPCLFSVSESLMDFNTSGKL